MNKTELKKLITRHQHWVNQDCKGWEKMRLDLSGQTLSNLRLSWACESMYNADLNHAYICNTEWTGIILNFADLSHATITDTILDGVDLCFADLSWADLSRSNLRNLNAENANLSHAKLYQAKIYSSNFVKANLNNVNLDDSSLTVSNLSGASLVGASLREADLHDANLTNADLTGADLTGANLSNANLTGAILKDTKLDEANLHNATMSEKDKFRKGMVLQKPIRGYTMCCGGIIATSEIPAGAVVYCINGTHCRTNMAKIISLGGKQSLTTYQVCLGDIYDVINLTPKQNILVPNFDTEYNVDWGNGFHFFRTRKEAQEYDK